MCTCMPVNMHMLGHGHATRQMPTCARICTWCLGHALFVSSILKLSISHLLDTCLSFDVWDLFSVWMHMALIMYSCYTEFKCLQVLVIAMLLKMIMRRRFSIIQASILFVFLCLYILKSDANLDFY